MVLPYIAMFVIDWRLKQRQKKIKTLEEVNQEFIENIEKATTEKDDEEEEGAESTDAEPDE